MLNLRQNFDILRITSIFSALLGFVLSAGTSFGFIDGGVEYGVRQGTWQQGDSDHSISAQTIRVSGHLDPIPLLPVAFGLGIYSETWDAKAEDHGLKSLSSFSVVPEVVGWIPLEPFKPFARLGYSVASGYSGKAVLGSGEGNVSFAGLGLHMGAGLEYIVPVVPLLSVLAEVEYSAERLRMVQDKIGGTEVPDDVKTVDLKSTAILVGVKLGF